MTNQYQAELKQFYIDHPWPDKVGIDRLYKYMGFDSAKKRYLESLFIEGKLYHSIPGQFNDPFECKPHFKLPESPEKLERIAQHLHKVATDKGFSHSQADEIVRKNMNTPENLESIILDAAIITYGEIRVCCFTPSNSNLLLWSHYGDSHRGFCIEFNATKFPISCAYKVSYRTNYPTIEYPMPLNELGFIPALVKSPDWSYEDEFRTIFISESPGPIVTDGESIILERTDITGVYFGANMDDKVVSVVTKMIEEGPFSPSLWKAVLSQRSYELKFRQISP